MLLNHYTTSELWIKLSPKCGLLWALFLVSCLEFAHAQCAGADGALTVCDKYGDIANRTLDLFAILEGNPQPGGVWSTTNPITLAALEEGTGVVDLWRINQFGPHEFTYTNPVCDESATVTIRLGAYAGENNIDGSANACDQDSSVNLFTFLGSLNIDEVPDSNGLWEIDPPSDMGLVNGNLFDAMTAGPGVYAFTYTVPTVDFCPGQQVNVILEVFPGPNSGMPSELIVCATDDDLSNYTELDLNGLLVGEDSDGVWSEGNTNQIDDITDRTVNVQEINANFGLGTYSFTYTVFSTNPVCPSSQTVVDIVILPVLDGTLTAPNYCLGTPYTITLDYDPLLLPDGTYEIIYRVSSDAGTQDFTIVIDLNNGLGTFTVPQSDMPLNRPVTLDIIGIRGTDPEVDLCPTVFVSPATFLVSDPLASSENVCPNTGAAVVLENIFDVLGVPAHTTYDIAYVLTGPDGSVNTLIAPNVSFSEGMATFTVPPNYLTVSGTHTVDITVEGSLTVDCTLSTTVGVIGAQDADFGTCDLEEDFGFFIPDGFSPNNDGRNDTFHIPNIENIFPRFTLEIFNRYGNSLFKGDAQNPAWDGSEIGRNTAPNGVYFYIITFNQEGYAPRQGRLYLSR